MLLDVRNFSIRISGRDIVSIDSLSLGVGERLGLVGESGSGKTLLAMSIAGLEPVAAQVTGSIMLDGTEMLTLSDRERARARGRLIGVVFQDPLRSLNPLMQIGRQIAETLHMNTSLTRPQIVARVKDLLASVTLPTDDEFLSRYPHQLSGGQRQRALIAMAIAHSPKLILADEPTTALDVTVQQEILELLLTLCREHNIAMIFVSHNLGVVRAVSERVAVMYGGKIVERGPVNSVLRDPAHRYTQALIGANPGRLKVAELPSLQGQELETVEGGVPNPQNYPTGCRFRPRCRSVVHGCEHPVPEQVRGDGHAFYCLNPTGNAHVS